MLSPGKYHQSVPKDLPANLRFRINVLEAAAADPNLQRGLVEMCRRDCLFFVNAFVWQINPRHVGDEVGPFISWPFQDAALLDTILRLFEDEDDMLWEKSREMGATWLALIVAVWLTLFFPHKRVLFISHSEEAVTKSGDDGTLFAKVEFILRRLPDWLAKGWRRWKKGFRMASGSNISAAASTERSGVGDRCSFVLLDEFSKQRDADAILGQTADTGPRLFIGTHYGIGTAYNRLCERPDMRKIVLHWSQHPDKNPGLYRSGTKGGYEAVDRNYPFPPDYAFVTDGLPTGGPFPGIRSPWYDRECRRRANSRDVAMHLDINPAGSVSQFFNALTIRDLILAHASPPVWEGDLIFDPDTGIPDRLREREGGSIRMWIKPTQTGLIAPRRYAAACDVSQGSGTTRSCLSLGDVALGEKVLELATPFIEPKPFAVLAVALCRLFMDQTGEGAELVWEIPGPGQAFGAKVAELDYFRVWRRVREDMLSKVVTENTGWVNNPSNANRLLIEYRTALESGQFLNRSEPALRETLAFLYDQGGNVKHPGADSPGDPSGAKINHGDVGMSDAMLWMLMKGNGPGGRKAVEQEIPYNSFLGRRLKRQAQDRENDSNWFEESRWGLRR